MPRMVDDAGQPIFATGPSILSTPSGIDNNAVSTFTPVATVLAAAEASTIVVTAPTAASTNHEKALEGLIRDQQAIQAGLDNQTPRNLMIAFAGILVIAMFLAHPRFLARLMASLRRTSEIPQPSYGTDTPPNSATPLRQAPTRPVGGGDLKTGWILKKGRDISAPMDQQSIRSTPFSPYEEYYAGVEALPTLPTRSPPPHIVPLIDHLPFASSFLWAPFARLPRWISSSVELSELYLIIAYLFLNAFAMIWRSDITPTTAEKGYGYDFYRTGLVAMVQMPLVVALGVRGNIIGLCVGKGYEKLKRLHKIVGQVLFLAATLHTAFYFHKFIVKGTMTKMLPKPFILAGLISWIAIVMIAITSIPKVRQSFYGVFKVCHIAGMVMLLVGMCVHVTVAVPWCLAALSIYGISIICTLTKTRLAHAELVSLPSANTTVITIPALRTGWRAGQHVRIRIPALGMPNGLEGHPLTIASAPDGEGMVLMCKVAGGWTEKLFDLANDMARSTIDDRNGHRKVMATVVLEGPYGGLGNTLLPSFSGVVLNAGGSGITQALSLANDLVNRAPSGVVRARTIDLIWTVRTEEIARPMMPTLLDMVEDAKVFEEKCLEGRKLQRDMPSPVALRVHIHVSRCPASSPITLLDRAAGQLVFDPFAAEHDEKFERSGLRRQHSAAEKEKQDWLSKTRVKNLSVPSTLSSHRDQGYYSPLSCISVYKRRPDFKVILEGVVGEVIDRSNRERTDPSGVCVTACGPYEMVNSVRDAVRGIEGKRRRLVGGIEVEEEQFGY